MGSEFNYKFNERKMKSYLSKRLGIKIDEPTFKECKDEFIDMYKYIDSETSGKHPIQTGASMELQINDDSYEVWVTYHKIIEDSEATILVDFDYSYDDFIDNISY